MGNEYKWRELTWFTRFYTVHNAEACLFMYLARKPMAHVLIRTKCQWSKCSGKMYVHMVTKIKRICSCPEKHFRSNRDWISNAIPLNPIVYPTTGCFTNGVDKVYASIDEYNVLVMWTFIVTKRRVIDRAARNCTDHDVIYFRDCNSVIIDFGSKQIKVNLNSLSTTMYNFLVIRNKVVRTHAHLRSRSIQHAKSGTAWIKDLW